MTTQLYPSAKKVPEILTQLSDSLGEEDLPKALTLFAIAETKGVWTALFSTPNALERVIGRQATQRLVRALAFQPCQFCRRGRLRCSNCDGHGHIDAKTVCEECLCFGSVRCDFCDGSGWQALEDYPPGFQPGIMSTRAETAIKRLRRFLRKPLRPVPSRASLDITKQYCRGIAYLDRYLGVLENTVVGYKKRGQAASSRPDKLRRVVESCIQTGLRAKERLRDFYRALTQSAKTEAQNADKSGAAGERARARADLYRARLDPAAILFNSLEQHPFLDRVLADRKNGI